MPMEQAAPEDQAETIWILEITEDKLEATTLSALAKTHMSAPFLLQGERAPSRMLAICFLSVMTAVPACGSKKARAVSQAEEQRREGHKRVVESELLEPAVRTWTRWVQQAAQAASARPGTVPLPQVRAFSHVEMNDKREVGLMAVVARLNAVGLYISVKRKRMLAPVWGSTAAYCTQHLPPTCSFVVHMGGQAVQHLHARVTSGSNPGSAQSPPSPTADLRLNGQTRQHDSGACQVSALQPLQSEPDSAQHATSSSSEVFFTARLPSNVLLSTPTSGRLPAGSGFQPESNPHQQNPPAPSAHGSSQQAPPISYPRIAAYLQGPTALPDPQASQQVPGQQTGWNSDTWSPSAPLQAAASLTPSVPGQLSPDALASWQQALAAAVLGSAAAQPATRSAPVSMAELAEQMQRMFGSNSFSGSNLLQTSGGPLHVAPDLQARPMGRAADGAQLPDSSYGVLASAGGTQPNSQRAEGGDGEALAQVPAGGLLPAFEERLRAAEAAHAELRRKLLMQNEAAQAEAAAARARQAAQAAQEAAASLAQAQLQYAAERERREQFRRFSKEEILEATNGFDPERVIGEGGYGTVYRGTHAFTPVAVKRIKDPSLARALADFKKEVDIHAALRHPCLVLLMGQCEAPPCLVYEYLPRGSLQDWLKVGAPALPWHQRVALLEDLVRALLYLHTRTPAIVHLDIKPGNILLDKNFSAKLGDVGLAEFLITADPTKSFACRTSAVGTFGYVDPEFGHTAEFSPASDVYSLGQVLWDLLAGLGPEGQRGRGEGAVQKLQDAVEDDDVEALMRSLDPGAGDWPPVVAQKLGQLASHCCHVRRSRRPQLAGRIMEVVEELRGMVSGFKEGSERAAMLAQVEARVEVERAAVQRNVQALLESHLEKEFICPITQDVMVDPVMIADGHTYEREAIEKWLLAHRTSPMTNEPLATKTIIPNIRMRSMIRQQEERQQKMEIGQPGGTT